MSEKDRHSKQSNDATVPNAAAPALAHHEEILPEAPWLRRFPLLSPTLPPATHTNIYLLGQDELLICDPGAAEASENDRLLDKIAELQRAGQRVSGIFLTHHHHDHVAGAAYLQARLRVPIFAHPLTAERTAARRLIVDRLVNEGDRLPFGPADRGVLESGFLALHTPGHAPGHLCLLDIAGGGLIAGDMVASVGTILVSPTDDGDMGIYLQSLARLAQLCDDYRQQHGVPLRLWPAHGASIADGAPWLRFYIAHRLEREAKVVAALRQAAGPLDRLWPLVYADKPDVPPPLAMLALQAHLQKLEHEGRARQESGIWSLIG